MAHFHLCWELGGGLGHVGRLKIIAEALLARGHRVSLGLRDLVQSHAVLAGIDAPQLQAPVWLHQVEGMPANHGSLAEILLSTGYLEAGALAGLVAGWRAMFRQLAPDVVVGDYAPTAMLAARSLGLPCASVGSAFAMPPPGCPLPCLRPWEAIPPQRLAAAEARVLQVANAVLSLHRARHFACAAELLLGDLPLLTSWPELDPYGRPAPSASRPASATAPDAGAAPAHSSASPVPPSAAPQAASAAPTLAAPAAPPAAQAAPAAPGGVPSTRVVQASSLRPSTIRLASGRAGTASPAPVPASVPSAAPAVAVPQTPLPAATGGGPEGAVPGGNPDWYGPAFLSGNGEPPAWPPGDGPKVLAYLKTGHAAHGEVLAALAQEGCRVLCFLPEVAGGKAPPVRAPNLAYAPRPLALRAALAEAQLCVTHAGEATLAQSMLAGVPVLMLPMQLEQFLVGQGVANAGIGLNTAMLAQPVDWRRVVRHMLATPAYGQAAAAFARSRQSYTAEAMAGRVALALETLAP